jgi:hypothetical protein
VQHALQDIGVAAGRHRFEEVAGDKLCAIGESGRLQGVLGAGRRMGEVVNGAP